MDDFLTLRRLSTPITTGIPQTIPTEYTETVPGESFDDILNAQLGKESEKTIDATDLGASGVNFSKHAMNRVLQRNIDLSAENLSRLNEGIRLADEKGLNDTLILVDSAAYIVSVKNNTVITTVASNELQGNVFTNIDGAVVV